MRFQLSCAALGLALVAGAPAANAQTVITREIVDQPVETVITQQPTATVVAQQPLVTMPAAAVVQPETVQTTETIRSVPLRTAHRRVVTTRTITRRVIPARTVIARTVPATPQPLYDEVAPTPIAATPQPLYDEVAAPAVAAVAAPGAVVANTPVVENGAVVATQPYIYRYVYQPDRILVIDPTTGIAVQSIPR